MATKEAAFHRLVEMGREQGFVTLDQVNATLPIDSMSQTELAQTLDRLERSGVSVEVDEELTRRPRVYDGDEADDVPDFRLPEPPTTKTRSCRCGRRRSPGTDRGRGGRWR